MKPIIVDVREPEEYRQGHVDGSINIPLSQLSQFPNIVTAPKHTPIVAYCNSGSRATTAVIVLSQLGYNNLTNGINRMTVEQLLGG